MSDNKINFVDIAKRYSMLTKGQQAELRRVAKPDQLLLIPAFYRLLPGIKTGSQWQRIVFFLPFVKHAENASTLGEQLAKKVSEQRIFQVIRSEKPNDIIQLRRLVQQVEPTLDWQSFGETLYFWNSKKKRRLLENYFLHLSAPKKGH